jgi:V/A-type H+-transporting ATPase subunit I
MAIARMEKVLIVSHRSEASELLDRLQTEGIIEILNAEQAMVTKDWPELSVEVKGPKDTEELAGRLGKSIEFLKQHSPVQKGLLDALSPRAVVEHKRYSEVVSAEDSLRLLRQSEECAARIEALETEYENCVGHLQMLEPWDGLTTPVEMLGDFEYVSCLVGSIPEQQVDEVKGQIAELGGALETVGKTGHFFACVIICPKESIIEIQKQLRAADFTPVAFEGLSGTAAELIAQERAKLVGIKKELADQNHRTVEFAKEEVKLGILFDHYQNLAFREQARTRAPATEHTVLLEGWVKSRDYQRLEKIVAEFPASSASKVTLGEEEQIPVEIENKNLVRPFEVITRLYGMPQHFEVDPTAFLAPFFALFFALCLTDAGYGLIMIVLIAFLIKKTQGDKKFMWLLMCCSVVTIGTGAMTGGWFGDAIQKFIPALAPLREKLMWFDPFEKPMMFFALSLAIGYVHILTGLIIAFFHNLKLKDYAAAMFDQLTWLVMLNSLLIFGAGKGGFVPATIGSFFGRLALVPAAMIFLFSHREGSWPGRIGMGAYNLFSAIFYMGDILSYLRLMALGMVTGGLAMAANVLAQVSLEIPYVGFLVMIVILVGVHGFNMALSGLSAFVHTLRLQYVEFFPKFFAGGGRLFEPLSKKYKHVYIKNSKTGFK